MPKNIDQTVLTKEAGIKCICIECHHKTICGFANALWAAKTRSIKYGQFYPSFLTIKCDRRENDLDSPIFSMTQLHLFFVKFGVAHLCDECEEKSACDFYYSAVAAHDIAEAQCFNPWHIVYKCQGLTKYWHKDKKGEVI